MSETASHTLNGVPETSLAALYWRAMESQRPDALIKDQKAEALVAQLDYDFDRIKQIPMPELLYVMRTMLTREMDRYARGSLGHNPEAVVVHIGCGLDSRFERACCLNRKCYRARYRCLINDVTEAVAIDALD